MSKPFKNSFTLFLLLIRPACVTFAQSETGTLFLTFKPGARANAMGGAQAAIADDIFASYYNPSGLANAKVAMAGFFQTDIWRKEQTHTYWGGVWKTNHGAFGFSLYNFSIPSEFIPFAENLATQRQRDDWYERAYQVSYARRVSKDWLFGGNLKYVRKKFTFPSSEKTLSAWVVDFGVIINNLLPHTALFYRSQDLPELLRRLNRERPPGFSLGITLQNTGPDKLKYLDASQQDPLPQMLRVGIAYNVIDNAALQILFSFDMVKELVQRRGDGSSDNFVKAWFTSWDDGLDYLHFGAELTIFHVVAFRLGQEKIYNLYNNGTDEEITLGFGFGPEIARVNLVRRGFPLWKEPSWVLDFSVSH